MLKNTLDTEKKYTHVEKQKENKKTKKQKAKGARVRNCANGPGPIQQIPAKFCQGLK